MVMKNYLSTPLAIPMPLQDRRVDEDVRAVIAYLEKKAFAPDCVKTLFLYVMERIQTLSNSDACTFFTNNVNDTKSLFPILDDDLTELSSGQPDQIIIKARVTEWINGKLIPNCACYFNEPVPKSHRRLLNQRHKTSAIMIVPFLYVGELKAVFVFTKKAGTFSASVLSRIEPILESLAYVLGTIYHVRRPCLGWHDDFINANFVKSLLGSSSLMTIACNEDNKIVMANPAAIAMFSPSENSKTTFLGSDIKQILPTYKALFNFSHNKKESIKYNINTRFYRFKEQLVYKPDGSGFLANMNLFQYQNEERKYIVLQIQNVSEVKEQAKKRKENDQQLTALTHLIPVAVVNIDATWHCKYSNDKWHEFTGLTEDETRGKGWVNGFHNDDVQALLEDLRNTMNTGQDYQKELRLVSLFGSIKWVDFHARVLFDDDGSVLGFIGTFQDITERVLQQGKLTQLAQYDSLTGLTNRSLFQDRLQQAFFHSQRGNDVITVMFLDLDGFKDINDSLGHDVGDLLLCEVANRLMNTLRKNDTVARFGGDEFVILLGINEQAAIVTGVAEKIIKSISEPFNISEYEIFVTVSVGVASGTFKNSSSKQILKNADSALYEAKREGKNTYQIFNANIDAKSQSRVSLANQLRYALQEKQYHLYFQPIANVDNNEIVACEALLRFKKNDGTMEESSTLISVLEETGMIIDVGKWVIEQTCKQISNWQKKGLFPKRGFVSFNVSAKQLLDHNIVLLIQQACAKYKIEPSCLVMELTETVFISKPDRVAEVLVDLKTLGLKIALDDFGTGYSSLSYLQKFPFDHLKIDRSFVENLSADNNNANITKTIVLLAHSLNMKVIAEGVTNIETRKMLEDFGANYYQGYLLGRPESAMKTTRILKKVKSLGKV